jgi:hypothetical protein
VTDRLTRTDTYAYNALGQPLAGMRPGGQPAEPERMPTTTLVTTVYTYDLSNRLTNAGGQSYTWDNNGNLLADGVLRYTLRLRSGQAL